MVHPIFVTVLRRPELFFTHLANHAELVKSELSAFGASLALRAASAVLALVALMLALSLTGIAVMLGFLRGSMEWVLVIVPGVAWLLAVIGAVLAMRSSSVMKKVDDVKDELEADVRVLRLVKEAKND
ncbi:hypothetical protein WKW79_35880 [Variovorax robiniae]|uniref:Phage holin family protein n=1 Tax=Variovorax robiniae TaxID=1836199 RepID=A0ABU8XJC2_9BURK